MSLLANLKTDDSIQNEQDAIGGSRLLDSGLYHCKVKMAYLLAAGSGAIGLHLTFITTDNQEFNQTLYLTSGTQKGCLNYYVNKNGEKQYLPGFNLGNALALLTVGKEIAQLDSEEKVVKTYSAEVKAEVPTKVDYLPELVDQEIIVGLIKQISPKSIKDASGKYVPTGETREENDIDKFFRASDRKTTAEVRAQEETASYIDKWEARWAGKVKDRTKNMPAATPGAPKLAGVPAASTAKPTTSLFK